MKPYFGEVCNAQNVIPKGSRPPVLAAAMSLNEVGVKFDLQRVLLTDFPHVSWTLTDPIKTRHTGCTIAD